MSFDIRLDDDPVITCPYNSTHKIARSRIQKHLVKCEKSYPVNYKQQCPYDATHRFFDHEMKDHIANCKMKDTNTLTKEYYYTQILPKLNLEIEASLQRCINDENCVNKDDVTHNPFNKPELETVRVQQQAKFVPVTGDSAMPKRDITKLHRLFGYSESMSKVSNETIDDDFLTDMVTNNMAIGRGKILTANRGHNGRGFGRISR